MFNCIGFYFIHTNCICFSGGYHVWGGVSPVTYMEERIQYMGIIPVLDIFINTTVLLCRRAFFRSCYIRCWSRTGSLFHFCNQIALFKISFKKRN
jgi:hypothetical protein